jgi:hypothetical protein
MMVPLPLCCYADGLHRICDFDQNPCNFLIDKSMVNPDYVGQYCPKRKNQIGDED